MNDITKVLIINAQPERVFKAISDTDELTQWFPDVAYMEPKVNGRVNFKFLKKRADNLIDKDYLMEGKITEFEENKKLSYSWTHPDIPEFPETLVSWLLEPTETGMTQVTVNHTGFDDKKTANMYNEGWSWFTGRLSIFARDK